MRPSKIKQFENYIKQNFENICYWYKSENLIKKNFFGLYEPNPKLFDRVEDYTLIMSSEK
ncbi:MAG: hypothetical protein H8D22_10365 [Candidatus Cloacimonetes bacterium]|nr:hypothetical protein [Candidatus Cloacimonadota bacterium]